MQAKALAWTSQQTYRDELREHCKEILRDAGIDSPVLPAICEPRPDGVIHNPRIMAAYCGWLIADLPGDIRTDCKPQELVCKLAESCEGDRNEERCLRAHWRMSKARFNELEARSLERHIPFNTVLLECAGDLEGEPPPGHVESLAAQCPYLSREELDAMLADALDDLPDAVVH